VSNPNRPHIRLARLVAGYGLIFQTVGDVHETLERDCLIPGIETVSHASRQAPG
jgi:hypothetical protein